MTDTEAGFAASDVMATTASSALDLRGVSFDYGRDPVLTDVSLTVRPGELVALVGSSGAGKSTLLALSAGIVSARSGRAETLGVDLATVRARVRRSVGGRVGIVAQQPNLPGPLRVIHAVNAGRLGQWSLARSVRSLVAPVGVNDVRAVLRRVGIEDLIFERVDSLSGGQVQRVAVARLLLSQPQLVLADEPTSAVDPVWSAEVMGALRELTDAGAGALVSLHDVTLARAHCDRIIGVRDGVVTFDAPTHEVSDGALDGVFRTNRPGPTTPR